MLQASFASSAFSPKSRVVFAFFARSARNVQRARQIVVLFWRVFLQVYRLVVFDEQMSRMDGIDQGRVQPALLDDSCRVNRFFQTHLLAISQKHANWRLDVVVIAHPVEVQSESRTMLDHQPLVVLPPCAQVVLRIVANPLHKFCECPPKRDEGWHVLFIETDELARSLCDSALNGWKRVALKCVDLYAIFSGYDFCRSDLNNFRDLVFLISQCRFKVKNNDLQALSHPVCIVSIMARIGHRKQNKDKSGCLIETKKDKNP